MSIEDNQVRQVAHLARLELSDEEVARYRDDLNSILTLVERMNACDTEGVKPMSNPLDATQRLRADVVTEEIDREEFLKGAPEVRNGLFLVPKVI
jgi:aspartyl-tRNA(Asn)/glutamyl-tRNA(Gln) amidotransferase subunit C